jgi:hypothetical protein
VGGDAGRGDEADGEVGAEPRSCLIVFGPCQASRMSRMTAPTMTILFCFATFACA